MPFSIYHDLSTEVLFFAGDVSAVSSRFVTMVTPVIQAGLAMQIVVHGYRIIRGEGGQNHFLDVFTKCLRAFLVFTLVLAGGMYEENVRQFIIGLSNDVLVGFGGDPNKNKYQQIDLAMQAGFDAFDRVVDWGKRHITFSLFKIDISGVWAILAGALMILLILIMGVIACAELLVVDFGLYIIFGVGPLFVACYAFESTARFFDTWLSGVLKWTFTAVVITVTVLMAVNLLSEFAIRLTAAGNLSQVLVVILSASAATLALMVIVGRAQTIAGDLVGGSGLNSMAKRAGSQLAGGMSGVKGALVRSLGGAAKGGPAGAAAAAAGRGGAGAAATARSGAAQTAGSGPGVRMMQSARR